MNAKGTGMAEQFSTFDWMDFAEGRARFCGATRGWDERGHETFAIEIEGKEYFGELESTFLPDRHNYNISILSFGYEDKGYAGSLPPWKAFNSSDLQTAHALIVKLIRAGLNLSRRPVSLVETESSRFVGKVVFPAGWATELTKLGAVAKAPPSAEELAR